MKKIKVKTLPHPEYIGPLTILLKLPGMTEFAEDDQEDGITDEYGWLVLSPRQNCRNCEAGAAGECSLIRHSLIGTDANGRKIKTIKGRVSVPSDQPLSGPWLRNLKRSLNRQVPNSVFADSEFILEE